MFPDFRVCQVLNCIVHYLLFRFPIYTLNNLSKKDKFV